MPTLLLSFTKEVRLLLTFKFLIMSKKSRFTKEDLLRIVRAEVKKYGKIRKGSLAAIVQQTIDKRS